MTDASQKSMDSKLLHMGNYSQQIASHRQIHKYRAVPLNILREGGLLFRVTTSFGISIVALWKIIKKYPPTTGKNVLFPLRIINGTFLIMASCEFESPHWHPHCIFSAGTKSILEYMCPVQTMYLSDEKSTTDEK